MTTTEQTPVRDGKVDAIRRIQLFHTVDDYAIGQLAERFTPLHLTAGSVLFEQEDPGDAFYLIRSGTVRIVPGGHGSSQDLARLGPGQYFGEMALFTGQPRTAAAIAAEECELLALSAADFRLLVDRFPALRAAMERVTEHRGSGGRFFENEAYPLALLAETADRFTIGSALDNAIVLDGAGVAAHHAELVREGAGFRIRDLGSSTGTYRNRALVSEAVVEDGDVLWLGSSRLFLHDGALRLFQPTRGVRIDSRGVGRTVGNGKQILRDVDLTIYSGELVALVGPSGAGKTTLLHVLLGIDAPTSGDVLYDGLNLAGHQDRFRSVLGFVPQQDIVHSELTAREALAHAAKLRLSPGATSDDVRRRIETVLETTRLRPHADVHVGRLSGGQRKRASMAVELLSDPRVIFLDEPTSGLDPGLDDQVMQSLREMADAGRTVVVTTHATRNVAICDRVVIVCGGRIAFVGTPREALDHFGVEDFVQVYPLLENANADELVARFQASPAYGRNLEGRLVATAGAAEAAMPWARHGTPGDRVRRGGRQYLALLQRDALIVRRDHVSLGLRVLGPPALAASVATSFHREIFATKLADGGNAREAITLLYLTCAVALFLGSLMFSNIITREDAIYRRERLVNLSPVAYVLSKLTLLTGFAALQGLLMMLIVAGAIALPGPNPAAFLQLLGALMLTSLAGMTMGMFISALSPNADRAAIIAVLAIVPQLIFGGSTIPRSQMQPVARSNSDAMISKWTLELMGDIASLDERLAVQSVRMAQAADGSAPVEVRIATPYDNAFKIDPAVRWAVIAGFVVLFTGGTIFVQARKGRPRR